MAQSDDRLRNHPAERFAEPVKQFNLKAAIAALPSESVLRQGHIQKTLYRHGAATTAIFLFEPGGGLSSHTVSGQAIIHVLEGEVAIRTTGHEYILTQQDLLVLDAGVEHDLKANETSHVLLHVFLDRRE